MEKYLIESMEHAQGMFKVWWRANSCGYTQDLSEAGRYSKEEADEICKRAGPDNERAWKESQVLDGKAGSLRQVVSN